MTETEYSEQFKNDDVPKENKEKGLDDKYKDIDVDEIILTKKVGTDYSYKHKVVWKNVIGFFILYSLCIRGAFLALMGEIRLVTIVWTFFIGYITGIGITVGSHRLFAHRTFKATTFLKVILIILQTAAGQNGIYIWCRDHRLHHRYSDTDGDPHNSKRGYFFCHVGWLMHRKHPYVLKLGKRIDMSDLESDWMVMFQHKYYYVLYTIFAVVIPVFVPWYYWGESFKNSLLFCYFFRYITQLNVTWLVNSAAHLYGTRPYDKNMQPVDTWLVSVLTFGEGWHNYHHTFPWDYKAAELSDHINHSAILIEFFQRIGLAYDLKSASPDMVRRRIQKSGDGTHYDLGNEESKKAVSAIGPLHPLNPTYNVTYEPPNVLIKGEGLPLYHENDVMNANVVKRNAAKA
ncbi:acyl-CoA Delta-9 desaturase-like [Aricia agestis]|uniref:acyl-CoA Delta-9 desaturase-like n=1 Tax=Aricia agestis TaxID=91739 RepID=UPI001C204856|nr:acyl-CoA Delta-9 desaturase-like [Aricia agestis]